MSKTEFSENDARFMSRALELARRGLFTTDPNPRVGCVIVNQGEIVGEGWHQFAGEPHAEIHALMAAGDSARGSTVYVTLEPCSHHGRTPPCADALVKQGVARVVAAMEDPNPLVSGNGLRRLSEAGIATQSGLFTEEAARLNPGFIKRMQTGRPLIRSKIGMSLDGRTAMASGESQWITGPDARRDVHRLRARSSAIVTGSGTLMADDPALTARLDNHPAPIKQPARVLLDSTLKCPTQAKVFDAYGEWHILTLSSPSEQDQTSIHTLPPAPSGLGLDLDAVADWLGLNGFNEVLFECGATLNGSLLASGIVDEWIIYMAPKILGDQGRGIFKLPELERLADAPRLRLIESRHVGEDIRLIFKST
jgi:diaminohydroxyphosphoribosylaminopyrimidine deaminase / 5-amino-6-(5-phosphoribosylamino)uracil reductase